MRLFFALVPDEALRLALGERARALAAALGGRAVPAHNVHLTLAFLGEVERARVPALHDILDAMPRDGFALALDCVGEWPRAGVAWIAPRIVPAPLAVLHAALAAALRVQGFAVEARPFHPHITLVRRPSRRLADAPADRLTWRVGRLSLMRTDTAGGAVRYREDAVVTLA